MEERFHVCLDICLSVSKNTFKFNFVVVQGRTRSTVVQIQMKGRSQKLVFTVFDVNKV